MKEIERFLNHLYYAAYCMTAWIAFVPTRKRVEYERSIELVWVLHGLSYFYIVDVVLLLKLLGDYVSGDIVTLLGVHNFTFFFLLLFVVIILIDFLIFHYFVYRGKKYIKYCREFEKESRLTKMMWSLFIILLYVIAALLLIFIFNFGQLYIAKPI